MLFQAEDGIRKPCVTGVQTCALPIYGSKGVNGVVIIRTKRGTAGTPRATITQRLGFSELQRGPGTRAFDTTSAFAQFVTDTTPAGAAAESTFIRSYEVNGVLPTYDHLRELAGN